MEVLQKITIYDLLGYTVPGSILVAVMEICFCEQKIELMLSTYEKQFGYICAITILLGYVMGMALAQLGKAIFGSYHFIANKCKKKKKSEAECIGKEKIRKALIKSGLDKKQLQNETDVNKLVKTYSGYMFADLQTDSKYSRIHNYASSELVCGNLTLALFIAGILLCIHKTSWIDLEKVVIYIGVTILFATRYELQKKRKEDYMVDWFVQKYNQ